MSSLQDWADFYPTLEAWLAKHATCPGDSSTGEINANAGHDHGEVAKSAVITSANAANPSSGATQTINADLVDVGVQVFQDWVKVPTGIEDLTMGLQELLNDMNMIPPDVKDLFKKKLTNEI